MLTLSVREEREGVRLSMYFVRMWTTTWNLNCQWNTDPESTQVRSVNSFHSLFHRLSHSHTIHVFDFTSSAFIKWSALENLFVFLRKFGHQIFSTRYIHIGRFFNSLLSMRTAEKKWTQARHTSVLWFMFECGREWAEVCLILELLNCGWSIFSKGQVDASSNIRRFRRVLRSNALEWR